MEGKNKYTGRNETSAASNRARVLCQQMALGQQQTASSVGHCFDLFHPLRLDTVSTMASSVNNRDPGVAAAGNPTDNISPRSALNYSSHCRRPFTGSCNDIRSTCSAEPFVMHRQTEQHLASRIVEQSF